ncbi:hypothetical protein Tco_0850620 [Tanacetum coccineum]
MMFLTSIIRKRKSSGKDSLNSYKERRLNYENYPKTKKLIDEFNLEEVFGENVKVCGYRRSEDVNQNIHNRELLDVIEIDVEVEMVKNDISKKQKDSSETQQECAFRIIIDLGFGSVIEMATEEIPVKIAHFVVDKFDADLMKLKLEHDVISITPDLVSCRVQKLTPPNARQDNSGYINEETRIENMDWCKYVCDCLKMSKTNWIRDDDNSYYSGPLTVLTLMYLTSTKSDSVSVPQEKHVIDNSSVDDDLTTRQRYFKLPLVLMKVSRNMGSARNQRIRLSNLNFSARILLSKNNSFKDEFQKEVEKVRSIDKKTRRELIEKAVLRRPAKVDEYFGKMKP